MKKFVSCRVIHTAPSASPDRECPACPDYSEPDKSTSQPGKFLVRSLIEQAYCVRRTEPGRAGRRLNIAV